MRASAIEVVAKVGGSLYSLPDLATRLRDWLDAEQSRWGGVVLVPGGGATADVVRELDRCHGLGEEHSHWLALRAITFNALFLAALIPSACVIADLSEAALAWREGRIPILDLYAFARNDEAHDGHLPHSWKVTSDAFAARAAVVGGARRLVLLKSTTIPEGTDWEEASRLGFVDSMFAEELRKAPAPVEVHAINLRAWRT